MKLTCVIVDDEYLAIKVLQEYSSKESGLTVQKTFTNPQEALDYLAKNQIDLLFLDIQMPRLSGFDLLKKLSKPPMVIFTTARHEYAVQAFDLDVLDYLVKPIALDRFQKAVIKASEYLQFKQAVRLKGENAQSFLMVKADYRIHKIITDQVNYIEGLSEYVKIHTSEKTYIPLISLKELLNQLPSDKFVRVHKSFIVSIAYITSYNHQEILLKNDKTLPIGRLYKPDFLKQMAKQ